MTQPKIGIIMGSQSDWPTMKEAADILDQLGVAYETKIVSAHRTPDRLWEYGKTAVSRGLQVIIAGAGGAAHLPGMMSSTPVTAGRNANVIRLAPKPATVPAAASSNGVMSSKSKGMKPSSVSAMKAASAAASIPMIQPKV